MLIDLWKLIKFGIKICGGILLFGLIIAGVTNNLTDSGKWTINILFWLGWAWFIFFSEK